MKTMESNSRRISPAAHWFNGLILTIFTLNKTVKKKDSNLWIGKNDFVKISTKSVLIFVSLESELST